MPDEELVIDPPLEDVPPAEPPSEPEPAVVAAPPAKKVLTIPTSAMAQIKADEHKKGEQKAQLAADRQAQELGYRDHAHMVTTLRAAKTRTRETPAADPEPQLAEPPVTTPAVPQRESDNRVVRENARLAEQNKKLNQLRARSEREAKRLQQQLDAQAAEGELRIAATRAGVQDVDYGVHLLRQRLGTMSAAQLESFDENAFFSAELRQSHPYLYRVEERPATTGPNGDGTNGGARPPATPVPTPPAGDPVDVRKMTHEQYTAHLRAKGLTPPNLGMPA